MDAEVFAGLIQIREGNLVVTGDMHPVGYNINKGNLSPQDN